ncbi:hypothetical protein L2E82_45144 [Cichorium intybus]|uniref:Uncharacterized protein n=1 Tax=Cichorium intybus TaxID=13427 RepID=A0ACB8ZSA5_CICIN|nr:hypothetical protein L2E82_45144 [Cichorium intybus]
MSTFNKHTDAIKGIINKLEAPILTSLDILSDQLEKSYTKLLEKMYDLLKEMFVMKAVSSVPKRGKYNLQRMAKSFRSHKSDYVNIKGLLWLMRSLGGVARHIPSSKLKSLAPLSIDHRTSSTFWFIFIRSRDCSKPICGVDSFLSQSCVIHDIYISQIQTFFSDMDGLWRSVASEPQRDLWKRKVEQISEEADFFRESLDRYFQRKQKRIQEAQERAELHLASDGVNASNTYVRATVVIGCGSERSGDYLDGIAPDGVLGLGLGDVSIPTLLAKSGITKNSFFYYCLYNSSGKCLYCLEQLSDTPSVTIKVTVNNTFVVHDATFVLNDIQNVKLNRKGGIEDEDVEENGHESGDPSAEKKPGVVWFIDLYRKFVASVNQLGIEKAVPKRNVDLMNVDGIIMENVASHLQVSSNGWAEGECQGKAGWFPLDYVECRENLSNSFSTK